MISLTMHRLRCGVEVDLTLFFLPSDHTVKDYNCNAVCILLISDWDIKVALDCTRKGHFQGVILKGAL